MLLMEPKATNGFGGIGGGMSSHVVGRLLIGCVRSSRARRPEFRSVVVMTAFEGPQNVP